MSQSQVTLAVLFADMCGSTALYEKLGEERARRIIAQFVLDLGAEVTKYKGLVIKSVGDEVLCTFPNAEVAMNAACSMQRAVARGIYDDDQKVKVRIGFHYGEVTCEDGEISGDTVNAAARVMSITRADQIMATLPAVNNLPPGLRSQLNQVMRAEFSQKEGFFEIFVVMWEPEDMLITRVGSPAFRKPSPSNNALVLRYQGKTVVVNNDRRSALLGREKYCDIYMVGEYVSREHARIELQSDRFTLIDQSTNSTFVRTKDGEIHSLNKDEMTLLGSGTISLGEPYSHDPVNLIEYTITSGDR